MHHLSLRIGQLCQPVSEPVRTPLLLNTPGVTTSLRTVAAGIDSSYILFQDGSVGGCGRNNVGQLGDGTNTDTDYTIVNTGNSEMINVFSGPSSSSAFFLASDGKIFSTGLNDRGQLGVGDRDDRNALAEVLFDSQSNTNTRARVSSSNTHAVQWDLP